MSSSKVVGQLAKPQMRNLLADRIQRNIIISAVLGVIGTFAYKVTICDARKARYAEFYRNFDVDKDFEEKRAKGIFTSC